MRRGTIHSLAPSDTPWLLWSRLHRIVDWLILVRPALVVGLFGLFAVAGLLVLFRRHDVDVLFGTEESRSWFDGF